MRLTLTYGHLPTFEQFAAHYADNVKGPYRVQNCKRVGNVTYYDANSLWLAVEKAADEFNGLGDEDAGDWASCIFSTLKIEWV